MKTKKKNLPLSLVVPWLFIFPLLSIAQADYPYQQIPFNQVKLTDNFWKPKLKINSEVVIPFCFQKCEETGRVKNFSIAAKEAQGEFCTKYAFDDSDLYKIIEAASYSLQSFPDKKLDRYLDSLIAIIAAAQEPDGYLYTARTIDPTGGSQLSRMGTQRWVKEREHSHELYNAGHLYESAYAHFMSTGKRNLLNVALKNADLIDQVFGPEKMHTIPGHQVIEMGLIKLFRITKDQKYLKLAKFFLDERGKYEYKLKQNGNGFENGEYWQDHKPVTQQFEAVGHAVRAGYMYAGMADVAALTQNASYIRAIDSLWQNVAGKKMYLTGGVGAAGDGERFGKNYELPNATAYAETCAAIAQVFWNHRMFMLHGESKYIDILEKVLYNGVISGVSLDGRSFFYSNAMEIDSKEEQPEAERHRSGWFSCACCPPNIARILAALPGYIYAQKEKQFFINLYIGSSTTFNINNQTVSIAQQSNYPWDGDIKVNVNPSKKTTFTLSVRIPGWALGNAMPTQLYAFSDQSISKPSLLLNGKPINFAINNGYVSITREWAKNDDLEIILPMLAKRVVANSKVSDDIGKIALQRGPLIYCGEWVDNRGEVANLIFPDGAKLTTENKPDLLGGIISIHAIIPQLTVSKDKESVSTKLWDFAAIPYYTWANRGEGTMKIWFPKKTEGVRIKP
ncbi:MAG: glycoside hydrolase family 127 protein [Bacteroidetes bacterium]|nr:glycoside hydrolase family 127 protein [Bacteroidota bacterium]